MFAESAAMMADAIGVTLDRMTFDVTFTAATGDSDLGFMQIPAGTVGGVMGYHRGWVGEHNVVSVGFNWTMGSHVEPPKPLAARPRHPGLRDAQHAHRAALPAAHGLDRTGFMGLGMIYTAMPVTNAVPDVVAAAPGIVTLADLPPITGRVWRLSLTSPVTLPGMSVMSSASPRATSHDAGLTGLEAARRRTPRLVATAVAARRVGVRLVVLASIAIGSRSDPARHRARRPARPVDATTSTSSSARCGSRGPSPACWWASPSASPAR